MNTENTENTENKPKHIIFLDNVQRTILGEFVEEDEKKLTVKNPVVIMINQDNAGKISVQLLPLLFREFLADKAGDVSFKYPKEIISTSNIEAIDFRLQAQYSQMFSKTNSFVTPQQQPPQQTEGGVINLFDE
jgi:hypothetical protein